MGQSETARGRDLSCAERAVIHSKIMRFWDFERRTIKYGGILEIRKLCSDAGVPCSEKSVQRIASEMKAQEDHSERVFMETHTAEGSVDDLIAAGTGDGWVPIIITQPPNSPDLNVNNLGFFHSQKTNVRLICTHCTSRVEMMANVLKAFEEYPADKLNDIWACYYNNLRSVMQSDGGNDYKQAHKS